MIEGSSRFEQLVTLIHNDPALQGIDVQVSRVGSKLTGDHEQISWVWVGGEIVDNPEGVATVQGSEGFESLLIRAPFLDLVTAEIHIWSQSFECAEDLRNRVIASLHRTLGGDVEFNGYSWFNESRGTADWAISGFKCTLQIRVPILVGTEVSSTVAEIDSQTHSGKWQKFQGTPTSAPNSQLPIEGSPIEVVC